MAKNIVICSDGTGNSFRKQVSNITRLVEFLDLSTPQSQTVFYDQGIGTDPKLVATVQAYKIELNTHRSGLEILPPPRLRLGRGLVTKLLGLTCGYGLRENVKEMYKALVENYEGPQDQVYLFGFSRGAFTVRAVAGLIYRCGVLPKDTHNFEEGFSEAYELYHVHDEDEQGISNFKTKYQVRECEIHFLGIWDTVKSYGGILPKSLPHLRHNPIVKTVCHALALHEHRAWFVPTSWGWIDRDTDAENEGCLRIKPDERRYAEQKKRIKEVWFRGCHSDIGGGDVEQETAAISLRWMLNEAYSCGLKLNPAGEQELIVEDSKLPEIHESRKRLWPITDCIPRRELDNRCSPPLRRWTWGKTGSRNPMDFRRNGKIAVHPSAHELPSR